MGIADEEAIGSTTTTKLSPAFASLLVGPIRTCSVRLCDIYLTFVNRLATMFARPAQARSIPTFLLPFSQARVQTRSLHNRIPQPPVPAPTPFVPDAETFLTLIGRNLKNHASKIPSWEALFSLTSTQLRDLGVEPPRARRYLLRWRDKFRRGEYGPGGDAKTVIDGMAPLRVVEVPATGRHIASATMTPGMKKIVANIPLNVDPLKLPVEQLPTLHGVHMKGAHTVIGPSVLPVKGTQGKLSKIQVADGLWEVKRGHKIDGGERRQAEVRTLRRAQERKAAREKAARA